MVIINIYNLKLQAVYIQNRNLLIKYATLT